MVLAETVAITHELYRLVSSIQKPQLSDRRWVKTICQRCHELSEQLLQMRAAIADQQKVLSQSLEKTATQLQAYAHTLESNPNLIRIKEMYKSLANGYERLRVELKPFKLQRLKTSNYARNIFHFGMGFIGVLLYEWVLSYHQVLGILLVLNAVFWSLELLRRFSPRWNEFLVERAFGAISRPCEHYQVNSATFYLLAITIVTAFFQKPVAQLAVFVLAFGDPIATLVGKRWGKRKIWREKSWIGTFAFMLVTFTASFVFLCLDAGNLALPGKFSLALTLAVTGAATEVFSSRVDDNFTIPILCALIASLWY